MKDVFKHIKRNFTILFSQNSELSNIFYENFTLHIIKMQNEAVAILYISR